MDLRNQSSLERNKDMEEAMAETEEVVKWASREFKEEGILTKIPLSTTTASSPCSSPSHEFSFTISFHSPSAAKSPSTLSRYSAFDPAPADDIFFHGHLLPLQLLSGPPPTSSPWSSRASQGAPAGPQERDVGQSRGDAAADAVTSANVNSSSSSSSSSSAASSNGDAKERSKNKFLSSLFMGKWRKAGEAGEREEEEEEKKRKRRAFDAMSKLLRRYMSAVEPLFSFRGGGRGGRRGEPLRRRPYSFAGNPSAGAAAGRGEEWRRRRAELSAPASMRTSPSNSGLLVAPPAAGNVGGSSEESTMEELRSAIEAAIAHCKSSVAMKEEKCKC